MKYRQLGSSELSVSAIGMGCVTFGREIDESMSFQVLDRAFERGINLYDTASAYGQGDSERVLGKWLAERGLRDQIVLATKVHGPLTKDRLLASAADSLRRLDTDRIDLFQLHIWDAATDLEETLDGLAQLVQQGTVRYVGCSNWQTWQLAKSLLMRQELGTPKFQSVQPPYNLVQREIEQDLLPLCADQQVGVISYSPLGAGFLTGKYRRQQSVPSGTRFDVIPGHQPIYLTDRGFAVLEQLEKVSRSCGQSMIQVALAWVLRQPALTSVLVGAREPSHVDQVFEAERLLSDDAVRNQLADLD